MIQTKILNLGDYKKIEDLERAMDTLANYEGFIFVGTSGKKNHLLIFQRAVQYPQPQQPELLPPDGDKRRGRKKEESPQPMFPNAVYR